MRCLDSAGLIVSNDSLANYHHLLFFYHKHSGSGRRRPWLPGHCHSLSPLFCTLGRLLIAENCQREAEVCCRGLGVCRHGCRNPEEVQVIGEEDEQLWKLLGWGGAGSGDACLHESVGLRKHL